MSDFEQEEYYVHRKGSFVGNAPVFWAKGGNGYTSYIQGAERFPEADAKKLHKEDPSKWKLYKCSEVDARLHLVYDMQDDKRLGTDAPCGWPWGYAAKQSMQGEAVEVVRVENLQQFRVMPNGAWMWCCTDDCIETINTHAPDSAARIAEQSAEIARLTKELEEARKDAESWMQACRTLSNSMADARADSRRMQAITEDYDDPSLRARKNDLLERMSVMSYTSACVDIDRLITDAVSASSDAAIRQSEPDASLNIKGGAE